MLTDGIEALRRGNGRVLPATWLIFAPIRRAKSVFKPLGRRPDRNSSWMMVVLAASVLGGMGPAGRGILTLALLVVFVVVCATRWE